MSGPYVCFRVNRTSRAILTDTIAFEPPFTLAIVSFTNPFEWFVVCDSADKVVIRALEDGKRTLAVIAMAQLRGQRLEDQRQIDPALPTKALWAWLEDVVFPTRERGYETRRPEAFDPAVLSEPPPGEPQMTPEAVWEMAATGHAPPGVAPWIAAPKPATRPRPQAPPAQPRPASPTAPLWGPVGPEKQGPPATNRYVEFLFDHASVCAVAGTVRYTPDHSVRPSGQYQMKVICDPQGNVTIHIQPDGELDMITIATARWKDSAMCDRKQGGGEPDDFQWMALEDGLRAELARAP